MSNELRYPKVAIIYLSYNPRPYIDRVIKSLEKITYPKDRLEFIVVDNPHPEFGGAGQFLKDKLLPLIGKELPKVTIIENTENLGFVKGNNIGIEYALQNNFDYVFLHNQDGFMGLDMLERMINFFKSQPNAGVVQPMILLYPEINKINTSGNKFHYLGFGYCGDYKMEVSNFTPPSSGLSSHSIKISYASGAAMMIRASLLKKYGALDKTIAMYHEDLEFCLRLRLNGFDICLAPSARFYHEYEYSRNKNKYYLMERNRYMVLLMYYKIPTLILFLPMFVITEIGILSMSVVKGWLRQKLQAYVWWFKLANWQTIISKRKEIQKNRVITDKVFLATAVSEIKFDDSEINNPILKYIGNPLMKYYLWLVKLVIFW